MPINFYPRLGVDGGAAGDLDNLDGATLQVNDIAMVGEGTSASFYIATEDANGESLPDIVVPDNNPGDWNWVLLDLGPKSVSTDYVQFDVNYSDTQAEGRLQWNAEDGTLEYGLPGGTVNLQVGQEHVVRVRNETGLLIANGTPVYIIGASGNKPLIALADADSTNSIPEAVVLGVTTEAIDDDANGFVTLMGLVRDVDTDGIDVGKMLWLSTTPGEYTDTKPTAPNRGVPIGQVIAAHSTEGVIYVRINVIPPMIGLSDVLSAAPNDNEVLKWVDGNSRFELYDLTDLIDGGDTTLHDHDGISENTDARHTQGTDVALGTMEADIDMDGSYQIVNLQAPDAAGQALRQTVNITEADLEQLTDGSDTTLHDHAGISENTTHRGSDGTDHDFIDQDVSAATAPTFEGTNITLLPLAGILDADKTGADADLVTGTKGDNLDFASWNADGDLVGSGYAASEIGVLATAAEWSGAQNFNEMAILSDTAAVAWDLDVRQCAVHVLTEDTTISEPTNMKGGGTYVLRIMQAVDVWTLSWNAAFKWGAAGPPAAPLGNADVIILSFYSDGTYMHGVEFIREEA
jgi:hypothetical protein